MTALNRLRRANASQPSSEFQSSSTDYSDYRRFWRCVRGRTEQIIYANQREQKGLAHALLPVEEHIDDDFMVILGDNVFEANLDGVVRHQREDRPDAFLVEELPWDEGWRYGVCNTNQYGEITDVVEKPDDPPSNLVMTGFFTRSHRPSSTHITSSSR